LFISGLPIYFTANSDAMKITSRFLLFSLVLLSFASCNSRKNKLTKVWFFITGYTASGKPINISPNDSLVNNLLTPACFINLQNDGKYSSFLYAFDYGTWKFENNEIILLNVKNQQQKLPVMVLDNNEMMVAVTDIKGHSFNCEFESASNSFNTDEQNPFSKQNNLWRIAASHKETDEEITARLMNHFQFWEKYFEWGIRTEQSTLDVRSTASPLKLYGNGFALKPYENLPVTWKQCFFDDEDCRKANDKLEKFIKSNDIAWPHTDHKYKMFLSAFQQMQQKMK